jgi:hypothetical protein
MIPSTDLTERQLLALLMRFAAWIIVVLIVSYSAWSIHNDYCASQALAKGTDPLGVACVFGSKSTACPLAAARGVRP